MVAPRAISDGIQATICATRLPPQREASQWRPPARATQAVTTVLPTSHAQQEPVYPHCSQPAGADQGAHLDYSELLSRMQNINQHLEAMADSPQAQKQTDMKQVYDQLRALEKQSRALGLLQAQLQPPITSTPPRCAENSKSFLASQPILSKAPPAPSRTSLRPRKTFDSSSKEEVKAETQPDPNTSTDSDAVQAFMRNEPPSFWLKSEVPCVWLKSAIKSGKQPEGSTSTTVETTTQPTTDDKPPVQAEAESKTEPKEVLTNDGQTIEPAEQPKSTVRMDEAPSSRKEPGQGESKVKSSSNEGKELSNAQDEEVKETKEAKETKTTNQVESKPGALTNSKGQANPSENKAEGFKLPPTGKTQLGASKSTEAVSEPKPDKPSSSAAPRVSAPPLRPPPAPVPVPKAGPFSNFARLKGLPEPRGSFVLLGSLPKLDLMQANADGTATSEPATTNITSGSGSGSAPLLNSGHRAPGPP